MRGLRRLSINQRMLLVGALPAVLAVVVLTTYHMINRWLDLREEHQRMAQLILQHISASAEYPLVSGNYELLRPLLNAALAQPAIVSVEILSPDGKPLIALQDKNYSELNADDMVIKQQPIMRELMKLDEFSEYGDGAMSEQKYGIIRLGMSDVVIRQQEYQIVRQSLFAGLLVVLLAAVIGLLVSRTILPALERLTRFINRLADGHTEERTQVDDGAEIGQLQTNVNQLAESLQQAEKDQLEYTEKLLAEQEKTQQASRAKSDFLAMMSHEIRTPLNGAIGMLQLMDLNNTDEEFDDFKQTADQSLTHLTQLLEDVLVVVDTEKNRLPVVFSEHKVAEVLKEMLESLISKAEEKGLQFRVSYDKALSASALQSDPSLIRQIVRHLVDNAIKFTDHGNVWLDLSLKQKDGKDCLAIMVTDTGIGIADDQKQRVLEAFAQVNSSFSRRHEGIGLGLTITQHICNLLDGELDIRSDGHTGTCVEAMIPVVPVKDKTRDERGDHATLRALIVEDNPVNLKVVERMLAKAWDGIEIDAVMSGEDCLHRLVHEEFDLILMDCQMPGLDGFETTRRLRESGIKTPIVACTANTTDQIRERCLQAGMDDYMAKPVKVPVLKETLGKWLPMKPLSL